MCTAGRTQEAGIYTTDADIQPLRNPTNTKQLVMTCPILKRPADCTRPGPSRLSFTPKPRPKQCVGELEIPGLPSTARTLFSGLRVSTHGKQAGPLVGFYHSAGRQPANSTPRPAGGFLPCVRPRGHIFSPIIIKFGQNVCLDKIREKFENGLNWDKN